MPTISLLRNLSFLNEFNNFLNNIYAHTQTHTHTHTHIVYIYIYIYSVSKSLYHLWSFGCFTEKKWNMIFIYIFVYRHKNDVTVCVEISEKKVCNFLMQLLLQWIELLCLNKKKKKKQYEILDWKHIVLICSSSYC